MESWESGVIAAVSVGLGMVIPKVVAYLRASREARDRRERSESELALSIYRELVTDLRVQVEKLVESTRVLEEEHIQCREAAARMAATIAALQERVRSIEQKEGGRPAPEGNS